MQDKNIILEPKKELSWGLTKLTGAKIDVETAPPEFSTCAIDLETTEEKEPKFVCGSLYCGENVVYYYDNLGDLAEAIIGFKLIGQNGKGDLKWLKSWGVEFPIDNYIFDTMLASSVHWPLRESHALKPLAKDVLHIEYPSYNDIVRQGNRRVTLDRQPYDVVSNYNCLDTYCTYALFEYFEKHFTKDQRKWFYDVEMPINRLLYEMETKGITLDVSYLGTLDKEFKSKLDSILCCIREITKEDIEHLINTYEENKLSGWQKTGYKRLSETKEFNPGSWQQKKLLLQFLGYEIKSTDKKKLVKYKGQKLIDLLLEHSEFKKLYTSFIEPFRGLATLPYVHTTYSQVSESRSDEDMAHMIKTGRLSSKQPNLQQVPTRTNNGEKLRKLFIARPGNIFCCADYGQIEKRLQAHFSQDKVLLDVFRDNTRDLFDETAKQLGITRDLAKTLHYALDFGAQTEKIAETLSIDFQKAQDIVGAYWLMFHGVHTWRNNEITNARTQGGVHTITGRFCPVDLSKLNDRREWVRQSEERYTISKKIQGSAADIIKLAMLQLKLKGYTLLLQVHDELVVETLEDKAELVAQDMVNTMSKIVKLSVPLPVEVGIGCNWQEAKV